MIVVYTLMKDYFKLIHNRDCHKDTSEMYRKLDGVCRELEEKILEEIEELEENSTK